MIFKLNGIIYQTYVIKLNMHLWKWLIHTQMLRHIPCKKIYIIIDRNLNIINQNISHLINLTKKMTQLWRNNLEEERNMWKYIEPTTKVPTGCQNQKPLALPFPACPVYPRWTQTNYKNSLLLFIKETPLVSLTPRT